MIQEWPDSKASAAFRFMAFENYLIFYLPHSGGMDVIRVLHGARDIDNLFAQER